MDSVACTSVVKTFVPTFEVFVNVHWSSPTSLELLRPGDFLVG